jgi:hypothetical protein
MGSISTLFQESCLSDLMASIVELSVVDKVHSFLAWDRGKSYRTLFVMVRMLVGAILNWISRIPASHPIFFADKLDH